MGVYGGYGWFFSAAGACGTPMACFASMVFQTLNESFFMATFFFISAYLSSGALRRKKDVRIFVKDKLLRLGVPLLGILLIINPLSMLVGFPYVGWKAVKERIWLHFGRLPFRATTGTGWFLSMLLIFDLVHACIYALKQYWKDRHHGPMSSLQSQSTNLPLNQPPSTAVWSKRRFITTFILTFTLIIPLALLFRTIPYRPPWNLFTNIIGPPAPLPQYAVLAYTAGTYLPSIAPYLWPIPSTSAPGSLTSASAYVWTRLTFSYVLSTSLLLQVGLYGTAIARWELKYLFFEIWHELSYVLLGTGWMLLFAFYDPTKTETPLPPHVRRILSFFTPRHSYAVYIIHPVILTAIMVALDFIEVWRDWEWCFVKAVIVGLTTAVTSWLAAKAFVKIPAVGRII
jgi:glucans biosynthesis protein C